jgi:hypothetical protein
MTTRTHLSPSERAELDQLSRSNSDTIARLAELGAQCDFQGAFCFTALHWIAKELGILDRIELEHERLVAAQLEGVEQMVEEARAQAAEAVDKKIEVARALPGTMAARGPW